MSALAPDLSVIIVNWNSARDLKRCLASLYQRTCGIGFEVIVVDNASYDGSDLLVREHFPQVRYVQSEENRGFAAANNWGVQHSSGRTLLFLNPDTEILGEAIITMVRALDSLEDAGAIGCRILNADGSLQTSCVQALPTLLNEALDSEALRRRFPKSQLWGVAPLLEPGSQPRKVEMISGACLMVRRQVFRQAGGFPTCYFMYGEDAELCYRVAQAGRPSYYVPTAEIIHYGGQSSGKREESMFSVRELQRSKGLYFANTRGRLVACLYRISRLCTAVLRLVLIGASILLASSLEKRTQRRVSLRKWAAIARWSLGLDSAPSSRSTTSAGMQRTEQRPNSAPREDLV